MDKTPSMTPPRRPRVELKFGTSGLRGLVADMTDREVYVNTAGFARFLLSSGQSNPGDRVAIGRDLRQLDPSTGLSSSPRIAAAVGSALLDSGLVPLNCGALPTPALAAFAFHGGHKPMACVMITGSHIPANRNGIKFYRPTGELMKADEPAVLAAVAELRRRIDAGSALFGDDDQLLSAPSLPAEDESASRAYVRRYTSLFEGSRPLAGKRVALYEHSAVGRDLLREVLESLGAEVVGLGRTDTFVAVDTEDVSALDEARYRDMVRSCGAFALVSTDGDSDRPLLVDETGRFHRGDALGLVTAETLRAQFAAVPVSATDAIDRRLEQLAARGVRMALTRTRIGSPFVIEAMERATAQGLSPVVGWEANGGFLLGSRTAYAAGELLPLPTRDATLPLIAVLVRAACEGRSVSALFQELPQRATRAGLLDDFDVASSQRIAALLTPTDRGAEHLSLVGPSDLPNGVAACRRRLEHIFAPRYGFGPIEWINWVDGIRVGFQGGDIAHIRPSGNAPQLRLYAVSDSQARADRIVELGIGPSGLLRQLEALTTPTVTARSNHGVEGGDPRLSNLAQLRRIVEENRGPRQVLAIVNGGDSALVEQELAEVSAEVFCADGQVVVAAHEETTRRGQFLGLLDAVRAFGESHRFEPGVALGIMLPGKGTRLSPITQRLHGIKPFIPTPIRVGSGGRLLTGAAASLYTWTLVAHHLERMGFRGIAWKWGDEPQLPMSRLDALSYDLSEVDAVRFGSKVRLTEDLARNKEWLRADEEGNLKVQLRRRPRAELCLAMGLDPADEHASAHVHIGSPALSHVFLEEAQAEFGATPGWLDVDGYLFEALTNDEASWAREVERDAGLRALLAERPDFYAQVRSLRRRIEDRRGHGLRMKVVDFGEGLFWADLGQLSRARDAYTALLAGGADGALARELMGLGAVRPDAHGNLVLGASSVPSDGSVTGCVVASSVLRHGVVAREAVIVESFVGAGRIEPGAVAVRCSLGSIALGRGSLCFESVATRLEVAPRHVHTSIPAADPTLELESYLADMGNDPGSPAFYNEPVLGNPASFAELFVRMRGRDISPEAQERRIAAKKAELSR